MKRRVLALLLISIFIVSAVACAAPAEDHSSNGAEHIAETVNPSVSQDKENSEAMEEICALNGTATQLFKAEYPEMVQYPVKDEFSYSYEDYEAWMQSRLARRPENTEYQNGIREFYEITMQEFLKDTQDENKIYSPLNVYMALAMLAETTDGESRQQILDLLHTDSIEALRNNASILWNANYCDEGTVNSLLASSVWLSDKLKYNENTLRDIYVLYLDGCRFITPYPSVEINHSISESRYFYMVQNSIDWYLQLIFNKDSGYNHNFSQEIFPLFVFFVSYYRSCLQSNFQ
jgi:hypothetical protein